MIKFKNKNQKTLVILISAILTLSFVGVLIGSSTTKAQSTPQEILEQVKLAYNVNNTYTLTPQDKIDNGCKYITSSLIPKSDISKIYKISEFNLEMKSHLEFLLGQQVKVNTIIAETQTYIDASGPNILSSDMTKYLDLMYDKFAQVSYPTQLAIDGLKVNLDKEG